MKTATVRQIRHDFGMVLHWVEDGEHVAVSKRGKVVALITPPPVVETAGPRKRPNFAARLRRIYGDSVLPGDVIVEERESRPY